MRIMVVPCDGIGPEITAATMEVLEATGKAFDLGLTFEEEETSFRRAWNHVAPGNDQAPAPLRSASSSALSRTWTIPARDKGQMTSPPLPDRPPTFANVRPARVRSFLPARVPSMDIVWSCEGGELPGPQYVQGHR